MLKLERLVVDCCGTTSMLALDRFWMDSFMLCYRLARVLLCLIDFVAEKASEVLFGERLGDNLSSGLSVRMKSFRK